ncbi:phage tail protein I [Enterobacter sp. EA-1]|nr:phage tail protein I [Enterobacter sp. EA-1]
MNDDRLLPVGSSGLEVAATTAAAQIERVPVPLRTLWIRKMPGGAAALRRGRSPSIAGITPGREATKRNVIAASFYVHQHKGTLSALHRVVEPLGFLIELREWWQDNAEPGTFKLVIGVQDNGITEAMYEELERLIDDAKPASRHLTSLNISLEYAGVSFMLAPAAISVKS